MTAPVLAVPTVNGRYYVHPAKRSSVPSITNILDQKSKPLYRAGLKAAAEYAADNISRMTGLKREEIFKLVSNPPRKDDSPSVIGDIVHGWIEQFILDHKAGLEAAPPENYNEAPQTARWMFERFGKFCQKYNPYFTATEFTVWSDKYGYAGTADWSARIAGFHVLADTKTGKAVFPEAAIQLAALASADVILDADGNERPVPAYDRYAILHLRPRSFTLHPVDNIDAAFRCFLALKHVFDWNITDATRSIGYAPQVN